MLVNHILSLFWFPNKNGKNTKRINIERQILPVCAPNSITGQIVMERIPIKLFYEELIFTFVTKRKSV